MNLNIDIVGGNEPQITARSIGSGSISWEREWQELGSNRGVPHKGATVLTVPWNLWENRANEGGYVQGLHICTLDSCPEQPITILDCTRYVMRILIQYEVCLLLAQEPIGQRKESR